MPTMDENQLTNSAFECWFCGYRSMLRLRECPECGRLARLPGARRNRTVESSAGKMRISTSPSQGEKEQRATESYVYLCAHCQFQTPRRLYECPECGRVRLERTTVPPSGAERDKSETIKTKNEKRNWVETIGLICLFLAFDIFFLGYGIGFENGAVVPLDYEIGECWPASLCLIVAGIPLYAYGRHLEKGYKRRSR